MTDRVLRDHRFLCEHAPSLMDYETADLYMLLGHEIDTSGELCPGGREVTIDYIKGRDAGRLVDDRIAAGESDENEIDVVTVIVDAALGEV